MTLETAPAAPSRSGESGHSRRRLALIVIVLALGGFGIGTTEFVAMGLLPNIASDLGIDEPTAGHLISAYAIGVVIGAPVIAVAASRMSRRSLLIWLMVAFTAGNALSLVAQSYGMLMVARVIAGLPHGAYFGVAALVAAHLAGPGRRAQAVGQVMLGLSVANVLGVPAATWLGQHFGWRSAIAMVVVIGVVTVAALWKVMPSLNDMATTDPRTELGGLKSRQIWLTLVVGMIGFGGFFAFYTYLNTALTTLGGLAEWTVPIALALFGLGMVTGNIVGGRLADRLGERAIVIGMTMAAVALGLFALVVSTGWPAIIVAFLVGSSGSIALPGLQTRLMDVAHDAQTIAAALNHSALNVANAIGAAAGGLVISLGWGYRAPSLIGAVFALSGAAILGVAVLADRRGAAAGSGAAVGTTD
ncbi:MFS transporter [Gordonia sp. HY442]|uniref:MFS transporter n=1 Tax=Gordonia zhenghanii TaxID=2911516 RepID=UPI001F1BDFD4|nr:MFS transporter [Gordonia zhenghanii]MCF8603832.1 MFS transporter [Gordonia zhenghanii]